MRDEPMSVCAYYGCGVELAASDFAKHELHDVHCGYRTGLLHPHVAESEESTQDAALDAFVAKLEAAVNAKPIRGAATPIKAPR